MDCEERGFPYPLDSCLGGPADGGTLPATAGQAGYRMKAVNGGRQRWVTERETVPGLLCESLHWLASEASAWFIAQVSRKFIKIIVLNCHLVNYSAWAGWVGLLSLTSTLLMTVLAPALLPWCGGPCAPSCGSTWVSMRQQLKTNVFQSRTSDYPNSQIFSFLSLSCLSKWSHLIAWTQNLNSS